MRTVWLCGKVVKDGDMWNVQGVFTSEELAIAACRDEYYFIGPVVVDESLPDEPVEWPGAYYPLARDEGE